MRAAGHERSLAPSIAAARKDKLLTKLRASLATKCKDLRSDVSGGYRTLLDLDHKQAFGVENIEKVEIFDHHEQAEQVVLNPLSL